MPVINTNISAMSAQRNLNNASMRSASSLNKLSSGSRVPSAKDDAASLALGTGLKIDVAAFRAAETNAKQATSLLQVADGAFGQISDVLARMKTLSTSAQSEQLSSTERGFLNTEFQLLISETNRIADSAEFNGVELLNLSAGLEVNTLGADLAAVDGIVGFEFDSSVVTPGQVFEVAFDLTNGNLMLRNNTTNQTETVNVATPSVGTTADYTFAELGVTIVLNDQFGETGTTFAANYNLDFDTVAAAAQFTSAAVAGPAPATTINFQVGIQNADEIGFTLQAGTAADLGLAGLAVGSIVNAEAASTAIDSAVDTVNTARATIGATMNRLEFAQSNLAVSIENNEAARSVLMDVDVATEMTRFTSEQVLIQAGVSMLAQANQQPSLLLSLLQ